MVSALPDELIELLRREPAAVVITPNERLAQGVALQWAELQRAEGQVVWQPVSALSWSAWLRSRWHLLLVTGGMDAPLLNRAQERRLWELIVRADPEASATMQRGANAGALASAAAASLQRISDFGGMARWRQERRRAEGDAAVFGRWCDAVERWAATHGWALESQAAERLAGILEKSGGVGETVMLFGWPELLPVQHQVLDAWTSAGGQVLRCNLAAAADATALQLRLADAATELQRCAAWAAQQVRAAEGKGVQIAIVAEDLATERDELLAALRDAFAETGSVAEIEVSLGGALAIEPMVRCATRVLRWCEAGLAPADLQEVMLSRYFGAASAEALEARAELLFRLDNEKPQVLPEMTASMLRRAADRLHLATRLPGLQEQLLVLQRRNETLRGDVRHDLAEWADWMRTTLAEAGWNSDHGAMDSRELQVVARWETALDTVAGLSVLGESLTFAEARGVLDRVLEQTVFAPQTKGAPVQVVGLREAAADRFAAAWVLRAQDDGWPGRQQALPLVPFWFQRELRMPGTDRQQDRAEARWLVDHLTRCAGLVVFSSACATAQGTQQAASALLQELDIREADPGDVVDSEVSAPSIPMETYEDAPWIEAPLPSPFPGGVRVLESQAACGFRSFAESRLHSDAPRERKPGFDAGQRGHLVHTVLDLFWKEVNDQATLLAMSEEAVDAALQRHITTAMERMRRGDAGNDRWSEAYRNAQRERLSRLLRRWLEMERRRPPFRVLDLESKGERTIGELSLELRIDRIDEDLQTGRRLLLDYKTGQAHPSAWEGNRPELPQVPVYLAVLEQDSRYKGTMGGAAFGLVQAGDSCSLHGVATSGLLQASRRAARSDDEILAQLAGWTAVVERLAEEVAGGDARVRPKQFPATCERCGQRLLCRVDAAQLEMELMDEAADEPGESHG